MSSHKSISQWTGVVIAVLALPFVGAFSSIVSATCMEAWGIESLVLTGLMFVAMTGIITIIIAWIVSKIVGFIIR